jgi:sugar phosphate isomerase/epimerase
MNNIYNISISNIAWQDEYDTAMYYFLQNQGFTGLEIAPTRLFPDSPYKRLTEASCFADTLRDNYGLGISSIQSIWFGRTENIFGSTGERERLIEYTKQAIAFAEVMHCSNLVFGCPRNRNIPTKLTHIEAMRQAEDFFAELAFLASRYGTVIALEPNPPIYNTNFINTTEAALELCKKINTHGLGVNIDIGTVLYNNENLINIKDAIHLVHHIHISEPELAVIEKRPIHHELQALLNETNYQGYVSIEMKDTGNIEVVKQTVRYIREVFLDI